MLDMRRCDIIEAGNQWSLFHKKSTAPSSSSGVLVLIWVKLLSFFEVMASFAVRFAVGIDHVKFEMPLE